MSTAAATATAPAAPATLASRLAGVRVGLRSDLDVTRHVFRGQPAYVIRDPMTFQSHRFDPADYAILVCLEETRTLGRIFADLVAGGTLRPRDEERFYQFVFQLHRLGLLNLPISDDKILYRRHRARQAARRRQAWLSILFLRVPLWNPDAFLSRTIRFVRPLFGTWFFLLWLLTVGAAALVTALRAHDLIRPLEAVLAADNLILMWFTLIGLKVFHEFGHAYACKHFGGHVPEMGAYLIAFTPCAYVDATAAWGFARRRDRVIVGLAGMYVEVFIAALAVFVWSLTSPSLLHSIAYNVMLLASVTTTLFNINPLMRYDGYYILSDLLEIPNLRARAAQYVLEWLKRHLLGLQLPRPPRSWMLRLTLGGYGVCCAVYRALLLIGIAAMMAAKFSLIGLFAAAAFLAGSLLSLGRKFFGYLWFAEEAAPVRRRAIAFSALTLAGVPTALCLVPVRWHIYARGVVQAENEVPIHAQAPGFLETIRAPVGSPVAAGQVLMELENPELNEALLEVQARLTAAEIRRDAYRAGDPARAQREQRTLEAITQELRRRLQDLQALRLCAPVAGQLVEGPREADAGRFYELGQAVATLASGGWVVRVVLNEEQMLASAPRPGQPVCFRPASRPRSAIAGVIERVRPLATRTIDSLALTRAGGGDIPVGPSRETLEPYFEVTVRLDADAQESLQRGVTGVVRLDAHPEPVGLLAYRSVIRFLDNLARG